MHFVFARNKPLIDMERRAVVPSNLDLKFRCGKCGFPGFNAHMRPLALNEARISELVCAGCKQVYAFDDVGRLEQGGKVEANGSND